MADNFADRLIEAIDRKRAPCVVGLDPAIDSMPDDLLDALGVSRSAPRQVLAGALLRFNKMVIDVVSDLVPAVKPNAAFYERYGSDGILALEQTIEYAKEKGLIIILDAKRGDIGNTAQAYADAYLRGDSSNPDYVGQAVDSLTVSPYLGEDTLAPICNQCLATGTGVFILVRTSNKGAATFQDVGSPERKLYETVADTVCNLGRPLIGKYGYSSIGAVVGATWPTEAKLLREQMSRSFFLVPGYGAQGGDLNTIKACFDKDGRGAIVNSSRGILYPKENTGLNYRERIEAACKKFVADIQSVSGYSS